MWAPPRPSFALQILWITLGLFFFLEAVFFFLKISSRNGVPTAVCFALFCWTSTQSFPMTLKDDQRALPAPMQVFPLNPVHRLFIWKRHFVLTSQLMFCTLLSGKLILHSHVITLSRPRCLPEFRISFRQLGPRTFFGVGGWVEFRGVKRQKSSNKTSIHCL